MIDAVLEEEKQWSSITTRKIVTLTFTYKSELFEKKRSYLIRSKAKAGDRIEISMNPKKTIDFNPHNLKLEIIWVSNFSAICWGATLFLHFHDRMVRLKSN